MLIFCLFVREKREKQEKQQLRVSENLLCEEWAAAAFKACEVTLLKHFRWSISCISRVMSAPNACESGELHPYSIEIISCIPSIHGHSQKQCSSESAEKQSNKQKKQRNQRNQCRPRNQCSRPAAFVGPAALAATAGGGKWPRQRAALARGGRAHWCV
jgi:hypothetical protein